MHHLTNTLMLAIMLSAMDERDAIARRLRGPGGGGGGGGAEPTKGKAAAGGGEAPGGNGGKKERRKTRKSVLNTNEITERMVRGCCTSMCVLLHA